MADAPPRAATTSDRPAPEGPEAGSARESEAAPARGNDSDLVLVARLQRGERTAFRELVRRHQDKVYRLALRLTRDESRAQDAMQDAFLQVYRKIGQFQEQSAFTTWLYRITVNAALMRMRSEKRHRESSLEEASPRYSEQGEIAEPVDDWSAAVDDDAGNRELAKYAQVAIDELPETYKSVFVLRELEEMSTEDVAQILDLTVPTVKTRLHRARLALRKALAERVKGSEFEQPDKKEGAT